MILWHFVIFIFFFSIVIESGKIRPDFDEIFGEEWKKNKSDEKLIKIEQNERNESSAVDQMGEEMGTDPIGQISEYSNQNVIKNNQKTKLEPNSQQKRAIIQKFEAIKEKLKQKGKLQTKDKNKIEVKIGKLLGASRDKIYKWKKELNLNKNKLKKSFYDEKKNEFIRRIDEFKSLYGQGKQKEFVKELGISEKTFRKWKNEMLPKYHKPHNKYSNKEKLQKMKHYFKIKERNPEIGDTKIAEKLQIGSTTLKKWKKMFSPFWTI